MESEETADLAELPMAVSSEADQLADSTKIKALSSDVGKIFLTTSDGNSILF